MFNKHLVEVMYTYKPSKYPQEWLFYSKKIVLVYHCVRSLEGLGSDSSNVSEDFVFNHKAPRSQPSYDVQCTSPAAELRVFDYLVVYQF